MTFKEIFSFVWHYLKNYKLKLFFAVLLMLFSTITEIFTPTISGIFIDYITNNPPNADNFKLSLPYFGMLMGVGVLFWVFKHSTWFFWTKISLGSLKELTQDSFYRIQRFSTEWHINTFAGSTVTKINRGMRGFQQFTDTIYYNFLSIIIVIFGLVAMVFIKSKFLGITILLLSIIYSLLSVYLTFKYALPVKRKERESYTKNSALLADNISCNSIVRGFGSEEKEDLLLKKSMHSIYYWNTQSWKTFELINVFQNTFMTIFKGLFLFIALYFWYKGIFSVGDFVFSMTSYHMISGYLRHIGSHTRALFESASDMEDIIEFSKTDFEVKDIRNAKDLKIKKGDIVFDKVTFKYKNQSKPIFKDLSFDIKPGEKVALVGKSGAGKTTFVKLLQRLYDIDKGSIYIDGQNIKEVKLQSLRENIVTVPQDSILFHRSLAENISYGNLKASKNEIIKAAKLAFADDFISKLPHKYDTLVGERGVKLSGGERQRVAIARAFLANKQILVLDEATSSLDSKSENLIQKAFETLMKGRTSIIIAHRLSTVKNADRIFLFDKGKIVGRGNHNELYKTNALYKELVDYQKYGFLEE